MIRDATPGDYAAYALLFVALENGDPVPSAARFAHELVARTTIAERDGRVVGYLLREELAGVGYIRNVVSDPTLRRSGIGAELMTDVRDRFVRSEAASWCLNVKTDNVAAIQLYERFGMRAAYRTSVLRLSSSVVLPPRDAGLVVSDVPADAEARIEDQFRLLAGQLASARGRGNRILQLLSGDAVLGVGVFMRSMPGAFPFRMTSPAHAATFLAELRLHGAPDARYLQLGVDDDDNLAAEVRRLGASELFALLHLRGHLR